MPILPDGTPLWWYLTAISTAVVIIGIAKAGFGGGIGILAVPLIANALPAQRALGVMLPILIFADLFAVWHHRRHCSWRHFRWTIVGAVVGVAAGTAVLWRFEHSPAGLTALLNLTVGAICLVFVLLQFYRMLGGKFPHIPPGPGGGAGAGGVAGAVSTLAHSAGPVMSIYFLEQKMEKRLLVGTMVFFFFALNCTKLPTYFGLGLINRATLVESTLFFPLVPVGAVIGIWMLKRLPQKPFTFIMYAAAGVAGARMIYKGLV